MKAVVALAQSPSDPLGGLGVIDRPEQGAPEAGWVPVSVQATALNHHDLWSLRGVGLPSDRLPMVLGTDAAGTTDDGREVIVHAVISRPSWRGDETFDPERSLLSERYPGTMAERVWVPQRNLVPKHPDLSWAQASCLPTAYLTAYRLLFSAAGLKPGDSVLVQGSGGGVATAAIILARAAGVRVWATSRSETKRELARTLGAVDAVEPGGRLPQQVDAVIETVGEATWAHSLRAVKPGGTIAVAGATSGQFPPAELGRVFFRSLRIVGSTMGTLAELQSVQDLLVTTGARPLIDEVAPSQDAARMFSRLESGDVHGKLVLTW